MIIINNEIIKLYDYQMIRTLSFRKFSLIEKKSAFGRQSLKHF